MQMYFEKRNKRRGRCLLFAAAALLAAAAAFCAFVALRPPAGVPILEYHTVDTQEDADSHPYNVPPEAFAASGRSASTISFVQPPRASVALAHV